VNTARVRLRDDVYYAESSRGALFLTHEGTVEITGRSVGQWISTIAPHLDGSHSLAELTAMLPPERGAIAEKLVTALLDRGIVREVALDDQRAPHGLDAAEIAAYQPEIDFIGYFVSSAGSAFERYRDTRVAVIGSGPLLPAVVRGFLRSGTRVLVTGAPGRGEVPRLLVWAGLVVHIADRLVVTEAEAIDRYCRDAGIPLAQVALTGGAAWLYPAGQPGAEDGGGASGWRRLASGDGTAPVGEPAAVTPPAAAVVAGQLVQDAVRYLTGTRTADMSGKLVRIELDTWHSDTHRFLPHPFSRACTAESEADFLAGLSELDCGPPLDPEEFSRGAARCVDSRTGVLGEIAEGDFAQLPLHVARATVADPVGLLTPGASRPLVTGAGPDLASARYETALRGLAVYGSLMVDPRRLLDSAGRALLAPSADPADALRRLRSGELAGWLWASGPVTGDPLLVRAGEVFPALRGRSVPYHPPCGLAAGYSWADAVGAALVQHCARLTIADAAASCRLVPAVDLKTAPLDPTASDYLAMLNAIGEPFSVHDVTGPLGVPVFACTLSGETVAYGCAAATGNALRLGLMQLLLSYQARANGQPGYAPPGVPGIRVPPPGAGTAPVAPARSLGVRDLTAALRARGRTPAVIPLNHDRSIDAIMPYIARVVVIGE
jgi:YcaO cyclodehydratase, ATP-ad Mg2+-binding